MNEYEGEGRQRGKTLLVVEGDHEKNELLGLIFRCFPELDIEMENVWVYSTNIYMLYENIEDEYGTGWIDDDIDLPFVVSRKQGKAPYCYKQDFTNIFLIFDYERHDIKFSETRILEMQDYFTDAADMGKLYINYPMIESYQHFCTLPDADFINRRVPVSLQPGKKYKELVRCETVIGGLVDFPHKIENFLRRCLGENTVQICGECCEILLSVSKEDDIEIGVDRVLKEIQGDEIRQTAKHYFTKLLMKTGYVQNRKTYWMFMRNIFQQIIIHNIIKAYKIQREQEQIEQYKYKDYFEKLDLVEILKEQNKSSGDLQNGFIWVLNTCVFLVAEFNFLLVLG